MTEEHISLRDYIEMQLTAARASVEVKTKEMDRRLEELDHLRGEVVEDRQRFMLREAYEEGHKALQARVEASEARADERREALRSDIQRQIDDLKRSRAILIGAGIVLVPIAGVIGAAITKAFGL